MDQIRKRNVISALVTSGLVFGLGYFNWCFIEADSPGYINMAPARDPLYPLFLAMFRFFLGDEYLQGVIIAQCILATFSICHAMNKLTELFRMGNILKVFVYAFLVLPFGLSTLWNVPRYSYPHAVLTEGLTYPLFYLFLTEIICAAINRSKKSFCMSAFILLIMTLTRFHMFVFAPVLVFVWILISINKIKGVFVGIGVAVAIFLLSNFGGSIYRYIITDGYTSSSENDITMLANAIYASDFEDAQLIEDESVKELFLRVWNQIETKKAIHKYAGNGIYKNGGWIAYSHDNIKGDILREELFVYIEEKGYSRDTKSDYMGDLVIQEGAQKLRKILVRDNWIQWIYDRISSFAYGLTIATVCITPPNLMNICHIISALFWIVMLIALITSMRVKKMNKIAYFSSIVMCCVLINVAGVSWFIFVNFRYTDFVWGWLMIAMVLLIRDISLPYIYTEKEKRR